MKVRRVVTGHSTEGKAVFVGDTEVEADMFALMRGAEFHKLWGADFPQQFPDDGLQPAARNYFPPIGGYRFGMFTLMPQDAPTIAGDPKAQLGEVEAKLPGLAEHMERDSPGMHTSDTVDFEYIISGEVWLELDDGASVHLRAGDTVVQNGTRHAWKNKSTEPCHIVVFMLGVSRHPSGLDVARQSHKTLGPQ